MVAHEGAIQEEMVIEVAVEAGDTGVVEEVPISKWVKSERHLIKP